MKKFIYKTISFLSLLLLILIITNYTIDPAQIFNQGYEKKIVEIITGGKNVITVPNYNERLFIYLASKKIKYKPNILILGSSRTMLLNSENLKDNSLINASVSSAVIEDIIIIYELFKENKILPKQKIIIGIDPWILNEKTGETRWTTYQKYYEKFLKKEIEDKQFSLFYSQLFSLSYFQSSIKIIVNGKLNFTPIPTNSKYNEETTILSDFSHIYPEKIRNRDKKQVSIEVDKYIKNNFYMMDNFKNPSKELFELFKQLIKDIRNNDIQVQLFIEPYHPKVYNAIQIKYPAVIETELLIKKYALENQIEVFGSFNPSVCNLNENYFYDGMHCNEKGVEKIIYEHELTTKNSPY